MANVQPRSVQPLFGGLSGTPESLFGADDDDQVPLGAEALAPPLPAPAIQMAAETSERVARAITELRGMSDRLAGELGATALEIGFLLARKILDKEIATDRDAVRSLVESAVRRVGDVHKVTVHLCPADVDAVRASAGESSPLAGMGIAKVEIVADTNLTPGDCIVESDAARVDGRLGTRLEELRRALSNVMNETEVNTR